MTQRDCGSRSAQRAHESLGGMFEGGPISERHDPLITRTRGETARMGEQRYGKPDFLA